MKASFVGVLVLLLSASCVPVRLDERQFRPFAPQGVCTVTLHDVQDGVDYSVRHYDADGKLLSATGEPATGGKAWETFWYDTGGRLSAIDAKSEWTGKTEGEKSPARRTVTHVNVVRDNSARVSREERKDQVYERNDKGEYLLAHTHQTERRLKYDDHGLPSELDITSEGETTVTDVEYADGQPRSVQSSAGQGGGVHRKEFTAAAGGALATESECDRQGEHCKAVSAETFTTDDQGRVLSRSLKRADAPTSEVNESWSYDAAGRVTGYTSQDAHEGEQKTHAVGYEYDANGRLLRMTRDGQPDTEFRYQGSCDKVSASVPPPALVERLDCVVSPFGALNTCEPASSPSK